MHRTTSSKPLKDLISLGVLPIKPERVVDYGCGHGIDVEELKKLYPDSEVLGYDKYIAPWNLIELSGKFDLIFCTYVLNVIPDEAERIQILKYLRSIVSREGRIFITSRTEKEIEKCARKSEQERYLDGYVTNANTFQRGYSEDSFKALLDKTFGADEMYYKIIRNSDYITIKLQERKN